MTPAFNSTTPDKDLLLLDRISIAARLYTRGDVVVLASPHVPNEAILKRIVGVEGDLVRSRDGDVVSVPRGHLWIEGDNAAVSNDSNHYGAVSEGLVRARVVAKLWPLSEAGRVASVPPPRSRVLRARSGSPR